MKIKAVFNETDERQKNYIKFLKKAFPETIDEENPDMYYVIGGDGAMLHAHKKFGHTNKPFFGKGFGTLNFIMNNYADDFVILDGLITDIIQPQIIQTEKLKVRVDRVYAETLEFQAINDIVIGNGIMDYHGFQINSELGSFENFFFKAAGICVSTPLGSTAYNINNNGKVLPPISELWSVTSIVGDHRVDEIMSPQKVEIEIKSERAEPIIYIDGIATSLQLCKGDKVTVEKSDIKFNLAFLDIEEFYKKRMKLIQQKR
jgi:NAD+ kinase